MTAQEEDAFNEHLNKVLRALRRAHKRVQHRLETQQQVLSQCLDWSTVNHEAELLQANLYKIKRGAVEVVVEDWLNEGKSRTLALEARVEPHLLVAKLFKKSKKLKAGIPHAERQLEVIMGQVAASEAVVLEAKQIADQLTLDDFCKKHGLDSETSQPLPVKKPDVEKPKPYHRFKLESGAEVWVGKNAKNNDLLTFQCANGNDWWLHAHNYPGSHVVIRTEKGEDPDRATLEDAAELALRYSKAKDFGEGEVSVTQVKFIRSVKGCPGKVMLSKHRALRIVLKKERFERLKKLL